MRGEKNVKICILMKEYLVAVRNFAKNTTVSTVRIVTLEGSIGVLYDCSFKNGKEEESSQSSAPELEGGSVNTESLLMHPFAL